MIAGAWASMPQHVQAGDGKLLLTGGVTSIDGAAGGGLTPWAVTSGYATPDQYAATAAFTRVDTQDYGLSIGGAAIGFGERFELSIARQDFATRATGDALGVPGLHLKLDVCGAKLLLAAMPSSTATRCCRRSRSGSRQSGSMPAHWYPRSLRLAPPITASTSI